MDIFSVPGVWPLKGTTKKAMLHYFGEGANPTFQFPPSGIVLEVAYFSASLQDSDIGKMQRENCDTLLLAWLLKGYSVKDDPEKLRAFKEAGANVAMRIKKRSSDSAKVGAAWQAKEDEEKNADVLGHSLLTRGRELVALQD